MTSLPMLTDLDDLCAALRDVDRRLGETRESLPTDNEIARQARDGIAIIRTDLLQDAIASLDALVQLDESATRRAESAELLERLAEPWPSENAEIRARLHAAVTRLLQVDDDLSELREHLVLPRDAEAMWESYVPMSFTANLYAALGAVHSAYLHPAILALMHAGRQSTDSLRRTFEHEHGLQSPATARLRPDGSVALAGDASSGEGAAARELSSQTQPEADGQRPCGPHTLPDLPFSSSGGGA